MWREIKVLLIDNHLSRQHDTAVILDFVGEHTLVADRSNWQQVATAGSQSSEEISAVIIGGDTITQGSDDSAIVQPATELDVRCSLPQLVTQLLQWDATIPMIYLGHQQDLDDLPSQQRRSILACLADSPSYNSFLDSLHRCQIFREQYTTNRNRSERRELQLFRSLVGNSRQIQKVRELIMQVADKDVGVMITGESGTGKEVVARNLHYHSHRRDKPFVPVNCGAIPAELLESELFGHEKGAFTGAICSRPGRFELAEGGTLFLDEIGDMPLNMQVKILRVLQEHTFERVGGNRTLQTNVRVIAATHKNLEDMIEEGSFREDLYYRLNVFPIDMPALRERAEDIPLLLNELISRMENEKRGSIRFNSAAIMSLCHHDWHGNVRELANLVERLAILHPYGVVGPAELPKKFRHMDAEGVESLPNSIPDVIQNQGLAGIDSPALLPVNGLDLREYLQDLECSLITQALDDSNGVVARAAEKLNIRRTTLVEKMRKYNLNRKEKDIA